ncbi:hypothetical protein [Celeribacter sp. PS-C1]|uniref:hypothetical protein n=1 Tax=Celeribacter sp. PS-C1 TaxID=2820813 RepID=UPI001CA5CF4D|nr:hypothetical protein [Celeribacter sp. PS-C1]MBW6418155.1 hypothetical protein [Celeribacter sp. PS-C1]
MTQKVPKSTRLTRRALLGMGLAIGLAACTQTLMTPEVAQGLSIRNISYSTANLKSMSVRNLPITKEQLVADLDVAIRRELAPHLARNGNADMQIDLTRVLLKGPELSLVAGGQSFIDAKVSVTRVSDGTPILAPKVFSGMDDEMRWGGIIGAMSAPPAVKDYNDTVAGFAVMLRKALFEGGATLY